MQYVHDAQGILHVDMEDGKPVLTFDANKCVQDIRDKFARLGTRTKIRNYTAGKAGSEARAAVVAGIATLYENRWGPEVASKVTLTEDELNDIAIGYMVNLKLLSGDKRPADAIRAAFTGLPSERRNELLAQHKRSVKKAQKEALDKKKGKTTKVVAWED